MDLESFRKYCLARKGVTEDFPFGEDTLVYKVMGKIFAITSFDSPLSVNLKCDPERAVELRERYEGIVPGYHMNKKHWNTVDFESGIPHSELRQFIDHSYELVVSSLPRKVKAMLESM
ncbi:MAG: MmcQ/YjbR family DNA-binding protein [Ignavibacteria bacterium]|nr:MmcQ/YjbR family DNA-binding protein [Ignavibacteria bacterium]